MVKIDLRSLFMDLKKGEEEMLANEQSMLSVK